MPTTLKELKLRLRQVQKEIPGLTAARLAEITGQSPSSVRRHLSLDSSSHPSMFAAVRLAEELGLSLDMVVFGKERPTGPIDERWQRMMQWGAHNLTAKQKESILDALAVAWEVPEKHSLNKPL